MCNAMCTACALESYEPRTAADESRQHTSQTHLVDPEELMAKKRRATSTVCKFFSFKKVGNGPNDSRVTNFPCLAKLARQYLCIPATSFYQSFQSWWEDCYVSQGSTTNGRF